MKIAVAGAFGRLGSCIVQELLNAGHYVSAIGRTIRSTSWSDSDMVNVHKIDVTDANTNYSKALLGVDILISTVGLTKYSETETAEMVDLSGNERLLQQAKSSGVKKFIYVSVVNAEDCDVPLVSSKYKFEQVLKKSELDWLIIRPTGYYYDIMNVFKPMIAKGTVTLIRDSKANIIAHEDLAKFIVESLNRSKEILSVGGSKDYTYSELATLMFNQAGKVPKIKYTPESFFRLLIKLNKKKRDILKFSHWTLTQDLIGSIHYGTADFKEFIGKNE